MQKGLQKMPSVIEVTGIAPPFGPYSHAVAVAPAENVLFVAGQVGVAPDGATPPDAAGQTKLVFDNISRILAAGGMQLQDIVKISFFVCDPGDLPEIRKVRDSLLRPPLPAASLVVVKALGRPEWRLEVECVAAKKAL